LGAQNRLAGGPSHLRERDPGEMRIELLQKSPTDDRLGTILSDGLRAGEQAWSPRYRRG
jgi:hypothetical protein